MEEYSSIADASKRLNISSGCISLTVSGKRPTAGGFHWLKTKNYSEVLKNKLLSTKTKNEIIRQPVMCVETGKTFRSISMAKKDTGCSNIARCCKNENYSDNGLHWRYVNAE